MSDNTVIQLERWTGPWEPHDPDGNFKADIALYAHVDPLQTLRTMSVNLGVPIGALGHYVLARWATAGSAGLLEVGPEMVRRLWDVCETAETVGDDGARLLAYDRLRQMLSWLRLPLDDPSVYGADATPAR